ncbi:hypothetical protein SAMN05444166_2840 [Singulisphaera sp. GP187]|nr:hypothetical protein SAMN05444166_2840 [Singulisphaera sp. GP187]
MRTGVPFAVTISVTFVGRRGAPAETSQSHHQRGHSQYHGHRITPWLKCMNVGLFP